MAKLAYDIILKPVITENSGQVHFQGCQGLQQDRDS